MINSEGIFNHLPSNDVSPIIEHSEYPLAPLTSWHIGGKAEKFIQPQDVMSLSHYLQQLPSHVFSTWIGLGSNVLIRDGGVKGVVICTRSLTNIDQHPDQTLYADAGVTCAKFSRVCCRAGFDNGAFFAGIPGTIGGALAMNAGAFGGETWEWVERVVVINTKGEVIERTPQEYEIGYRFVKLKARNAGAFDDEAFLGAYFRFPNNRSQDGLEKIKALLRKRAQSQPIGTLNCGSVYRNPPGEFAAKLIGGCDLKGFKIGGAGISEKHANFIINHGNATSNDVERLMETIEKAVKSKFQIELEREVRLIGI